ncbi:MAG: GTP cyclohydrolase FolE2 [Desulfohalobiaceae bacterium]|jgi:GTP cyclohydrolase I|nr:GTP cyclohydrolase FolE2 [Desulfohalobiaceae bacterium]
MQDIQKGPADVSMPIDRVGVKNLSYPLVVRYKDDGVQHTVAQVDLYVDLPGQFKGTHMSRFVETLQEWEGVLDYHSFRKLLRDVQSRLEARRSHLSFRFPFFLDQKSPQTKSPGLMEYQCQFEGSLEEGKPNMFLSVEVPVMTVCPCSLAISDQGAHSQRAMVRIKARFEGLLWLEDLIQIAQRSSSSPVYAVLKRADEKYVTEHSFANPKFVEDVVRTVGQQLKEHELVRWFKAEVESYESIHKHNAYACIEI